MTFSRVQPLKDPLYHPSHLLNVLYCFVSWFSSRMICVPAIKLLKIQKRRRRRRNGTKQLEMEMKWKSINVKYLHSTAYLHVRNKYKCHNLNENEIHHLRPPSLPPSECYIANLPVSVPMRKRLKKRNNVKKINRKKKQKRRLRTC